MPKAKPSPKRKPILGKVTRRILFLAVVAVFIAVVNTLIAPQPRKCLTVAEGDLYRISDSYRKEYHLLPADLHYFVTYGDENSQVRVELEEQGFLGSHEVLEREPMIVVAKPKNATATNQILGPIIVTRCGDFFYVDDGGWDSFSHPETPEWQSTMPPFA